MDKIPIRMELRWCNVRVWSFLCGALLLPSLASAAVLEPPSLRCTSVGPAGEAVLTWVVPPDPNGLFLRYDVFHATDPAGPFALVGQVATYAQSTFTHTGAGADAAPQYYYLTTVAAAAPPNTSSSSDTLATMFLQVTQSVPLGSSVVDWNLPHDPPLPGANPVGYVHMEYPVGTWALADSLINTLHHWQRVVSVCADSLTFRATLPDASGCISTSNAHGAFFQDISPPTVPTIVNLTVDTATNQAVLSWNPSPETDTDGYIIVLSTPGGNVILDTLYGQFNTTYTWPLSNAGAGPESYTVAAIDTCWKGTPPSPNTSAASNAHTSVHLATTYDRCAATIRVDRTDYTGWPVDHYELYLQLDHAGPLNLIALMDPATYQHVLTGVLPGREYCFVAKAVGLRETLSNLHCRTTAYPAVPQWNYLRTATIAGEDQVLVEDSVDTGAFTRRLLLERSHNGLPWEVLATAVPGTASVVAFIDTDALPADRSYTYRVLVEDSCGNTVVTSNTGNTIHLAATAGLGGVNQLLWNGYVQWAGNVSGYRVFRSVADGPFSLLATTGPAQWSFQDDVQGLWQSSGKCCYYVEAVEAGNPSGINALSTSNSACAVQQEEVWVPNAFIEGGYNNTFRPVLAYADVSGYEFTIFNRWGQQIWTTTDRHQAWDGRVGGGLVPQGVYAWYCTFRNGAGKTVEKRGTVTFVAGQ